MDLDLEMDLDMDMDSIHLFPPLTSGGGRGIYFNLKHYGRKKQRSRNRL